MHTLFRDIGIHANLGCVIEQIGGNCLWKQLTLLLRQHLSFDNALAIFCPANGVPVALEEYNVEPHAGSASMLAHLNGLYLPDLFYQACQEGLASGLYHLEEIAPDHLRQNEYYLSCFHDNVLEDEVQFILRMPGQGVLSLSLGMQGMLADEKYGIFGLFSSWVLAPMQQRWQQRSQRLLSVASQKEMATQIHDVLSHFGASVLSERELETARLTPRSYSLKVMVERLAILPETIKVHWRRLYAKLGISS